MTAGRAAKFCTVCATLCAVHVSAVPAAADSPIAATSVLGSQLNPSGLLPGIAADERGASLFLQHSRTPTGLLYPKPLAWPPMIQSNEHPDWWHAAWVDVGLLAGFGNTETASFREYGDWSPGLVVSLGFLAENRRSADFISGRAGSIGRGDQFYDFHFGRYGLYDVGLFYDAIPHLLSTNAKILWNGAGSSQLTLPPGIVSGATTAAAIDAALAERTESKLSVTRSKTGVNAVYTPYDGWELFLYLASEWRDGRQAIGSTFTFPGTRGVAELPQPIEYQTVDMTAGVRFKGENFQSNVTLASSFFRNANHSLSWDNPALGLAPGAFVPMRGRIALPPENDYHAIKADLAWALSDVRVTATAAYSLMRQDEALLPPVVNRGLTTVNLDNWNTIAALSRSSAKAEIRAFDGTARLAATPLTELRLTLDIRYRDEDNRTAYIAFNPLTGEYGYVGLDGALSRIYNPAVRGSDVPIRNIPFASDRLEFTARADYRLVPRTRVSLALRHKETERQQREVSSSDDDVLELQFSHTAAGLGTARLSYEYADRSGSGYVSDPNVSARSAGLPGYLQRAGGDPPYALASFAKYDVGERIEHRFNAKTNFILSPSTDLQVGGGAQLADYGGEYGLQTVRGYDAHATLATQLGAGSLSAFYAFTFRSRDVASINVGRGSGSDNSAGGPNYPLANAWTQDADDANHLFGATLHYPIAPVTIDLSYTVSIADSRLAYTYAGGGAITAGLTPAQAGSAFPDQDFANHLFEASLSWPFRDMIVIRGYYRLEHEELNDFHYTGSRNIIGNQLYLGAVPEDYTAHIVGAFTQWRF